MSDPTAPTPIDMDEICALIDGGDEDACHLLVTDEGADMDNFAWNRTVALIARLQAENERLRSAVREADDALKDLIASDPVAVLRYSEQLNRLAEPLDRALTATGSHDDA